MRVICFPFLAQMHIGGTHATLPTKPLKHPHRVFPPGLEPGTFRVLGERDNHYTTETDEETLQQAAVWKVWHLKLQVVLQLMSQCFDDQGVGI